MTWKVIVEPVSLGLETTGYAHMVVKGSRSITVTHHTHQNYDHIITRNIDGLVLQEGVGRREPDLTPHPEAVAIANALNEFDRK